MAAAKRKTNTKSKSKSKPFDGQAIIPSNLKNLIGTTVSRVRHMDVKPAHFVTNITNPMVRWGDKPYVQCRHDWCGRLVTASGRTKHEKACNPPEWYVKPTAHTAVVLKLVPGTKKRSQVTCNRS